MSSEPTEAICDETIEEKQDTNTNALGPLDLDNPHATPSAQEVLVLARVKAEYAPDMRTKLILVTRIIPNYSGRILGVADQVEVLENGLCPGTWSQPMCLLAILFPSMKLADRWSFSDPVFKDKDFPRPGASLEMVGIPVSVTPPPDFRAFLMTTFQLADNDSDSFQTDYVDEAAKFYHKHDVCYGVSVTRNIFDMRFGWVNQNEYVSIHTFPSMELLMSLYNDSEYEPLKTVMNNLTVSTTVAFDLKYPFLPSCPL